MRRLLSWLLAALLSVGVAFGQGTPVSPPPFAERLNVKRDYGAVGGTLGYVDGVVAAGSTAFSSALANFTAADVGKAVAITGAGTSGAPLSTTIAAVVDAHHVTLAAPAVTATPWSTVTGAAIATAQSGGGSYAPNDTITLTGGTASPFAVLTVRDTTLVSATVNAVGANGTTGACVLTGTTGTALGNVRFQVNATIAAGAISAIGSVVVGGNYTTNPTSLTAEPVTSNCLLTGATLGIKMGVGTRTIATAGSYSVVPGAPVSQGSTSGSGTGATFTLSTQTFGKFNYGTDDSAAFAAAITASNTKLLAGTPTCITIPAGVYFIKGTPLPMFSRGGCLLGDSSDKSILYIDPSYSGDVFSWSEGWMAATFPYNGETVATQNIQTGPTAIGIKIIGDRGAPAQQNGFVLYDRNDFVRFSDLSVHYLNGRALYAGGLKNQPISYLRETRMDQLRFFNDGQAGVPVVEFTIAGTAANANEARFTNLDIYAPYGPGLVLRAAATGVLSNYQFNRLRIEGLENNPAGIAADLLTVGDTALTGQVNNIDFSGLELIDPYTGFAAMRVTAQATATSPYQINVVGGSIGGGASAGKGLSIDFGRNLNFAFPGGVHTTDTNVTVLSNAGSGIVISGDGSEQNWTWILPSYPTNYNLRTPIYRYGDPSTGTFPSAGFSVNTHDGSNTFGNTLGQGAVDLQTQKSGPFQSATGVGSAVLGGGFNSAQGTNCATIGGSTNTCTGSFSAIIGSLSVQDRGRYGFFPQGSGAFAVAGDAQAGSTVLRCTTSTAATCRLTADMLAAGAANCVNLPNSTDYTLRLTLLAVDHTSPGNNYAASWSGGTVAPYLLTRGASAASTLINGVATAINPDASRTNGATTGIASTLTADTTNGCINVTFTPPTSNTDKWNALVKVETVEVQ